MIFNKVIKKDLLLINGFGLCLCLLIAILMAVSDKTLEHSTQPYEIKDEVVKKYQYPSNRQALKSLLVSHEANKALIRKSLELGFYVSMFLLLIFTANGIIIIKISLNPTVGNSDGHSECGPLSK